MKEDGPKSSHYHIRTIVSDTQPRNRMAKNLDKVEMTGEVEKVSHQEPHLFPGGDGPGAEIGGEVEKTRRRRRMRKTRTSLRTGS